MSIKSTRLKANFSEKYSVINASNQARFTNTLLAFHALDTFIRAAGICAQDSLKP